MNELWLDLQKDFAKSDLLRAKLTELGISVSDTAQGSFWEVSK
jgi:cysteinyl-tRNA synthetase